MHSKNGTLNQCSYTQIVLNFEMLSSKDVLSSDRMQWDVTEAVNEFALATEWMTFNMPTWQYSMRCISFRTRTGSPLGIPDSHVLSWLHWLWELLTLQSWSRWEIRTPTEKRCFYGNADFRFPPLLGFRVRVCMLEMYEQLHNHVPYTDLEREILKIEARLISCERSLIWKEPIIFWVSLECARPKSVLHKCSQGCLPQIIIVFNFWNRLDIINSNLEELSKKYCILWTQLTWLLNCSNSMTHVRRNAM